MFGDNEIDDEIDDEVMGLEYARVHTPMANNNLVDGSQISEMTVTGDMV